MVQQKNFKKRSVSESETDKKKPVEQGTVNIVSKKKKTENGSVQNGQGNKQMKMDVPKKFKNEKKTDKYVTVQTPKKQDTNEVGQEINKTSGVNNEEKKLKLLKKRQEFREKRKLDRVGNPRGLAIDLSVEDIKKKIQQIESREKVTKTAKRKLATLKKKLRIEEGTDKPSVVVKKETGKSKKEKSVAVPKKNEVQNNEQKKKVEAKLIKKENKKKQNIVLLSKVKKEEEEEEEEDEDEDEDVEDEASEDESESDVDLEEEEEDDDVDEEEEEEDDEDEDEDDEDDVEEAEAEEDVKIKIEQNKDSKVKVSNVQSPKEKGKAKNNEDESKKKRYVLFVGNLPYTITNEELKKHFLTKVGHIVDVRIPKKDANTARGFAYVELGNNVDYEKALSLHHSFVNGRRINVQYSGNDKKAGVAKNFKLHALKNAGKLAGGKKGYNQKFGGNKGRQNVRTTKT